MTIESFDLLSLGFLALAAFNSLLTWEAYLVGKRYNQWGVFAKLAPVTAAVWSIWYLAATR